MGTPDPGSTAEIAARISDEIAAIHRESYGETVDSIATEIHDDFVVCMLDVTLLPHEHTLLDHGRGEDSIRHDRPARDRLSQRDPHRSAVHPRVLQARADRLTPRVSGMARS